MTKPDIPTIEARIDALGAIMKRGSEPDGAATKLEAAVDRICAAAIVGDIKECNKTLHGPAFSEHQQRVAVRKRVNQNFFFPQEREWNLHGAPRTFRFWTPSEKMDYLDRTMRAANVLKVASPHVALGFGAALGFLRDGDFIPHDDDTDLIIAFNRAECPTLTRARQIAKDALTSAGFRCSGDYAAHWNVFFDNGQHCDVFVGLIEDDRVSWFPSERNNLAVSDVFPAASVEFYGIECAMPRDLEAYVAKTYGDDWRSPIANWNHPWQKSQFEDIL